MPKSPHLNPDWLRQKYAVEGLSTYDIGKMVGRDPKRIYEKLRDFGIPTRPRGHNLHGEDNSWAQPGYQPHWKGRQHTAETRAKMAAAAARPRPWLRGEANGMYGVVGDANPGWRGGISPERQRIYASSAWKEIVRQVIARDSGVCLRCFGAPAEPKGVHLHHVESWDTAPNLRMDVDNIVTLCRRCHEWVHSLANTECEWLGHNSPLRSSSAHT